MYMRQLWLRPFKEADGETDDHGSKCTQKQPSTDYSTFDGKLIVSVCRTVTMKTTTNIGLKWS